jgi:hypothetical protein
LTAFARLNQVFGEVRTRHRIRREFDRLDTKGATYCTGNEILRVEPSLNLINNVENKTMDKTVTAKNDRFLFGTDTSIVLIVPH